MATQTRRFPARLIQEPRLGAHGLRDNLSIQRLRLLLVPIRPPLRQQVGVLEGEQRALPGGCAGGVVRAAAEGCVVRQSLLATCADQLRPSGVRQVRQRMGEGWSRTAEKRQRAPCCQHIRDEG